MARVRASRIAARILVILPAIVIAIPSPLVARQSRSLLAMTVSSASASPGETLSVTLTSPADAAFAAVLLIGENPLQVMQGATSLPATFSVTIPRGIALGKYGLTAVGRTLSGEEVTAGMAISVERSDVPQSISTQSRILHFGEQGDEYPLTVLADFGGGDVVEVTASPHVTYKSSIPNVVAVNSDGMVRALNAGRASIVITYGRGEKIRTVTVPVVVPAPPLRVSPSPFDFGIQRIGTASSRELTLTNTLDSPVVISRIQAYADDFTSTDSCAAPLAPGDSCTITVVFAPARTGYSQKFIRVINEYSSFGISVSGTGSASARRP